MAVEYVNLSLPSTGGDGSSGDPWTGESFVARHKVAPEGTEFRLRGSFTSTNISDFFQTPNNHYYLSWDKSLYGPWRIESAPATGSLLYMMFLCYTIEGAILYSSQLGVTISAQLISNCYVKLDIGTIGVVCSTIKGGLFEYGGQCHFSGAVNNTLTCTDTVFKSSWENTFYIDSDDTATFNNCAFNTDEDKTFNSLSESRVTKVSCQFGWDAPTLPAWDAEQSDYDTSSIFAGINTPPQPGNPPYTDYDTDFWGNARTGIGAGYMGEITPPTPSPVPNPSQFTSEIFLGMPPKSNFTGASLQHSDTNRGNPHGNINDNSNGHNPVLDVLPRDSKLGNLNGNAVDNSAGNNPVDGLLKQWNNGNVPPIPRWLDL